MTKSPENENHDSEIEDSDDQKTTTKSPENGNTDSESEVSDDQKKTTTKRTESRNNNDTSLAANYEILRKIPSSCKNTVSLESLLKKPKPIWRLNVGETSEMLDCVERNISRLIGTDNEDQSESSVFPASSIRIGSWQKVAEKEGDIMVEWLYTHQNMVWEFFEGGFSQKIQIAWASIESIKADLHPTEPQTLEVQLGRPPKFFVDSNYPSSRHHCMWLPSPDFTCNQASNLGRHYLQFPRGGLEKHYRKLQQYNILNFIQ